jgi:hypothetical protein
MARVRARARVRVRLPASWPSHAERSEMTSWSEKVPTLASAGTSTGAKAPPSTAISCELV